MCAQTVLPKLSFLNLAVLAVTPRGCIGGFRGAASLHRYAMVQAMHSHRFDRPIILTRHARLRMDERNISEAELLSVIDTGETRYKDAVHLWAFKHIAERADNLVCAVLVLEDAVVVKTVMHHFSLEV